MILNKEKLRLILFNMSFFNEFINYFKLDDLSEKTSVSMVLGVGAVVLGNVKILELSKEKIVFKERKNVINVVGFDLYISSISRGEVVVLGNVQSVGYGEL